MEVFREGQMVFWDTMISAPFVGSEGDMAVDMSFEEETSAVLCELATAMVELEQDGAGSGWLEAKAVSRESSRAGRDVWGDDRAPQQAALPASE